MSDRKWAKPTHSPGEICGIINGILLRLTALEERVDRNDEEARSFIYRHEDTLRQLTKRVERESSRTDAQHRLILRHRSRQLQLQIHRRQNRRTLRYRM